MLFCQIRCQTNNYYFFHKKNLEFIKSGFRVHISTCQEVKSLSS